MEFPGFLPHWPADADRQRLHIRELVAFLKMPVPPTFVEWISLYSGYRRPLYQARHGFYAGNPWPVAGLHKTPVPDSGIWGNSGQSDRHLKHRKRNQDIVEEKQRYGI